MTEQPTIVRCPTCKQDVVWSTQNLYRPFCSKRCQLIDLGEWANENHHIAGDEIEEHEMWSEDNVLPFKRDE